MVFVVVAILLSGAAAAALIADAKSPSYALGSEFVYRVEIGAVTVVALLFSLTALNLASYGRTFTQFGAGTAQASAPDPAAALDDASRQLEELATDLRAELDALSNYVEELGQRLDRLDGGGASHR
jgi:hypothetical protein